MTERIRKTADERRVEVIEAAIDEFSALGYHGGSTETIARAAGISQPYVLRLFGTKKALYMAAVDHVVDRIRDLWAAALDRYLAATPLATVSGKIDAIGRAFYDLVDSTRELRLVLQAYASAEDPDIRAQVHANMNRLFTWVREHTGATVAEARAFFATGMTLMVAASVQAFEVADSQEWARAMLSPNV